MAATTTSIQSALEGLPNLPTPVRSWLVETGLDATDDPAVWVWAVIEHQDVDAKTLARLKSMVRDLVRDKTGGLWAYVRIRGAWESAPAS